MLAARGVFVTVAVVVVVVVIGGLGLALTGCGDDDGGTTPPPIPAGGNKPPGPASPNARVQPLPEKMHIEDRVTCPVPDKPTDPKDGACDPKAPSCAEHLYCLQLAQGSFCEPCPERDGIRHVFRDRDFVEQNRDPFQSPLSQLSADRPGRIPIDPTKKCLHKDQMVATSYSYAELKLVGIVAQGTQRKALMMGGPLGYIIKRGDCVGKEKAVVKDISNGYLTFLVDADTSAMNPRSSEEYTVHLNPKQLAANEPETSMPEPRTEAIPVVPPPATLPQQAGSGSAVAPPVELPPVAPKRP